jgi:hypothetical protein
MTAVANRIASFPSVLLKQSGVQVNLIAQLGHGGGSAMIQSALRLQGKHDTFVDALDEPSARIGPVDPSKRDFTALYTFAVNQGHPFHRHEGKRVFIGVAGSKGAQLAFANGEATDAIEFVRRVERVSVPPDALFTVRFGPRIWHRFQGVDKHHPAFFAISVHPDDSAGALSDEQRKLVELGEPTIASLTDVLPFDVAPELLASAPLVSLSLEGDASAARAAVCAVARGAAGRARTSIGSRRVGGWVLQSVPVREVNPQSCDVVLLQRQFAGETVQHSDAFELLFRPVDKQATPKQLLAAVLHGFVDNRPPIATALMRLRNTLVRPLRLRTSSLACPVSSLLGKECDNMFDDFPVFDSVADESRAEVVLGADDRHVRFRTAVSVAKVGNGQTRLSMSTKLITLNAFGRFYLAAIDVPHRKLISPQIMRFAVAHLIR